MIERFRIRIPARATGEFSSPELSFCADSYSVSYPTPCYHNGTSKTPVILPKVQVAGYICTYAYTLDPTKSVWADYAVQAQCGTYQENELTRNSSGNARPQSSQLAELLWTDPGLQSGIAVRKLVSTLKQNRKKRKCGIISSKIFSQNPHMRKKKMFNHQQHHHLTPGQP